MGPETKGTSYDKMLKERWENYTKAEGLNKWDNYPVAKFLDNGSAVFSDTYPFRFTEGRKLGRHTTKHKNDFPTPITSREQYILEVARLHRQPISEDHPGFITTEDGLMAQKKIYRFHKAHQLFSVAYEDGTLATSYKPADKRHPDPWLYFLWKYRRASAAQQGLPLPKA